jgi:hypothetical protein
MEFALNRFMRRPNLNLIPPGILVCFLSILCVLTPTRGNETSEHRDYLNGGYYLLHHLCEDEAKLPLLLDVKDAPPGIEKYADHISKTAKETIAALERMQESDASLKFDKNPLPLIERDVRESIQADKQHQLLFGTTGAEFVRALLVSQAEASSYALNLAKVLSQQESNPDRVKTLQHISVKWRAIHQDAMRLLRN